MHVYRYDPDTGKGAIAAEGVLGPNGLAFSPDEKILYIVESRGEPTRKILAYDVVDGGRKLTNKRILIDAGPGGTPDGFRVDVDGNLWCGWGMGSPALDGVLVFAPDGKPIGRIALPERCANVCFGGPKRNRLFMAGAQSLYALYTNTQGALAESLVTGFMPGIHPSACSGAGAWLDPGNAGMHRMRWGAVPNCPTTARTVHHPRPHPASASVCRARLAATAASAWARASAHRSRWCGALHRVSPSRHRQAYGTGEIVGAAIKNRPR
jgi:hypothetical protein